MAIEKVKSPTPSSSPYYEINNWKTPAFRQTMVDKLNNVIEETGIQLQCTGLELENGVFNKVNSKPMYMILIICIIENIKEMAEDSKAGMDSIIPNHQENLSDFENLLLY
ncbi:hypothetical protein PYW07_000786 [Mythimna separata]|uniref:Mediator of RNA polymerase II transcription subunit 15 n=1 Tax=Mythimna separata TaxID=271217 RepID=A0AAD7YTQ0_MYTSE|nr:hypothetical protein PYW07_000786 [Mythimna separata]